MRRFFKNLSEQQSIWFVIVIPVLLLTIFFYLISLNNVYVKTYDIERFNRAKETIRSPITVENEAETERKMRETVLAVGDRYTTLEEVTEQQLKYVEEIFAAVKKVIKNNEKDKETQTSNEELLIELRELLSSDISDKLDDMLFLKLLQLSDEERKLANELFLSGLKQILDEGVRVENLQSAREELTSKIKFSSLDENVKDALYDLVEFAVVENAIFDVEKTMEARKEAENNVQHVVNRSGDIIVREGQIITNEIYEELKLAGLLANERKIYPAIGLAILVIMLSSLIAYELSRLYRKRQLNLKKVSAIILISIIIVTMMKIFSIFVEQLNQLYLLVPIATGVLLIKLLVFERLSIVFALIFSILGSILFNGYIPGSLNVEAALYFLIFQFTAIMSLSNVKDRTALLKTALITALVNVLTLAVFIFLSFVHFYLFDTFIHISFAFGAAIFSTILTIGLLPFFETTFGILSDGKLLALANPNHPLLRKILTDAPGTYHHSVMVANLSESACEAIGANGLLARVASYYHDLGKTIKPSYFIENQMGIENPHNFLDPEKSAEIIINHPYDGARILKEHNLPKEIIDITKEHHGTSLLKYFYYKEKETNPDVDEKTYRYPGPLPQTKESAIVSLCDSIEAAVRSLDQPSNEKIDQLINSIIQERLSDGQLNDSDLTFNELTTIKRTISETLNGIYHSRIQYPTESKEAL